MHGLKEFVANGIGQAALRLQWESDCVPYPTTMPMDIFYVVFHCFSCLGEVLWKRVKKILCECGKWLR